MDDPPDDTPDDDDDLPAERQLFEDNVKPILEAKCSGDACHNGAAGQDPSKFLGPASGGDPIYQTLIGYPSVHGGFELELAGMVQRIEDPADRQHGTEAAEPLPTAQEVTYTEQELTYVSNWIAAEAVVRNDEDGDGEPDPPPLAAEDPLAQFSACMTLDDWNASNMGDWENKPSEEGDCEVCHDQGLARFNTNETNDTMFEMNRTELYLIGFFTVRVEPDGTETVIPATEKLMRMGNGNFHPNYNTDPNDQYFQYLEDFYQRTMENIEQGNCPDDGYPETPPA